MTAPTHRQYSICFGYVTLVILYNLGITNVNYYLALPLILMASRYGAVFPDLDHSWQNVSDKTFLNKIINVLIHATGGKHRSWQTHSIDIVIYSGLLSWFLPNKLYQVGMITDVNKEVLLLLLLGFMSGWVSHMFSDMLTSEGVRLVCILKFKIKLVPKRIGNLKFNTGHEWEKFNYKIVKVLNIFLSIICLAYPLIHEFILSN